MSHIVGSSLAESIQIKNLNMSASCCECFLKVRSHWKIVMILIIFEYSPSPISLRNIHPEPNSNPISQFSFPS